MVIDNEAGMERISRKTIENVETLLVVSDATAKGVRTAGRIYALARRLRIRIGAAYLIVTRTRATRRPCKGRSLPPASICWGWFPTIRKSRNTTCKESPCWVFLLIAPRSPPQETFSKNYGLTEKGVQLHASGSLQG